MLPCLLLLQYQQPSASAVQQHSSIGKAQSLLKVGILQRSYNSAGAAETGTPGLTAQASERSLPAWNSMPGSGRTLQTSASPEASKVDMWLRGSSARPLLLDTEEEPVEMGQPLPACTRWHPEMQLHGLSHSVRAAQLCCD